MLGKHSGLPFASLEDMPKIKKRIFLALFSFCLLGSCSKGLDSSAQLKGSQTPPPPAPLTAFSDDFQRTNSGTLGSNWIQEAGAFIIQNDAAVGQVSGSQAIVSNFSASDVVLNAPFLLNIASGTAIAHLIVRYSSSTGAYYEGSISTPTAGTGNSTAYIYYAPGGGQAEVMLNSFALSSSVTSGILNFSIVGNTMILSLNGIPILDALDQTISAAGGVGIQTGAANSFSNFQAVSYATTAVSLSASSPTFTDNFQRANSNILGSNWMLESSCGLAEGGDFAIVGNQAIVPSLTGTVTQVPPRCPNNVNLSGSRALVAGISAANVQISAKATPLTGSCVWVVARVVDSQNFYTGNVCNAQPADCGSSEAACVTVQKFVNGTGTILSQAPITLTSGPVQFTFTVQGSEISLTANGVTVNAADSTYSAPGTVGMIAPMGNSFSLFQATQLMF